MPQALRVRELYCPSHFGNVYEVAGRQEMRAVLSEARRQQESASGLGLAFAKSLLEVHGGSISVEIDLDKGTSFAIWIPTGRAMACLGL